MSQYQQRRKEAAGTPTSLKLFGFVYFFAILAAAFWLSGLVMEQKEIADLLNTELPGINKPMPELAAQLVLTAILFFIVQFISVFIFGLFAGRKKNIADDYY